MRTIVDLTDEQLAGLDRISRRRRVSRAAVLRQAVDDIIARDAPTVLDEVFGSITEEEARKLEATIRELRSEWDRP